MGDSARQGRLNRSGDWGLEAPTGRTAARDQAPASSPDAASLLRRRLLHSGYARDAQSRHLLPQVSAHACWLTPVDVRMCPFCWREATLAHARSLFGAKLELVDGWVGGGEAGDLGELSPDGKGRTHPHHP